MFILFRSKPRDYNFGRCLSRELGAYLIPCYASGPFTKLEQRYSQIEREALALTQAYDKFSHYITGLKERIETDHKPLI